MAITFIFNIIVAIKITVSGQLPPRKIAPRLGLGFGLGFALKLRLETIFLGGNCPRTKSYLPLLVCNNFFFLLKKVLNISNYYVLNCFNYFVFSLFFNFWISRFLSTSIHIFWHVLVYIYFLVMLGTKNYLPLLVCNNFFFLLKKVLNISNYYVLNCFNYFVFSLFFNFWISRFLSTSIHIFWYVLVYIYFLVMLFLKSYVCMWEYKIMYVMYVGV